MIRQLRGLLHAIRGLFFYTNPIESEHAATWRQEDLTRLARAPGLNASGLGKLIGAGLQHRIYDYDDAGQPMVLKFSVRNRFLRFPTMAEAQEDVQLVSTFFGPYAVLPVQVFALGDGAYAIRQRKLNRFRSLGRSDLKDERIRGQFCEIARRNEKMIREAGHSLDFLGREGQRKSRAALLGLGQTPVIANLVVEVQPDGSEQVRILDTDLENFRRGARALRDLRSAVAARLAYASNRLLVWRFFGVDIARA